MHLPLFIIYSKEEIYMKKYNFVKNFTSMSLFSINSIFFRDILDNFNQKKTYPSSLFLLSCSYTKQILKSSLFLTSFSLFNLSFTYFSPHFSSQSITSIDIFQWFIAKTEQIILTTFLWILIHPVLISVDYLPSKTLVRSYCI